MYAHGPRPLHDIHQSKLLQKSNITYIHRLAPIVRIIETFSEHRILLMGIYDYYP